MDKLLKDDEKKIENFHLTEFKAWKITIKRLPRWKYRREIKKTTWNSCNKKNLFIGILESQSQTFIYIY